MHPTERLEEILDGARHLPWVKVTAGVRSKTLALLGDGWVSLLELEPGANIPLHRHVGAVHGYLLAGKRRLGPDGRIVGPGSYEYEPAGQVDTWSAEGGDQLVGLFVVNGSVEYLGPSGEVMFRETAATKQHGYLRACDAQRIEPIDIHRG
jgi:quercetin dioxygenase-like cupin family protein